MGSSSSIFFEPNAIVRWASLAISTILDNLHDKRAASSRSETGKILRPEAAIKTLPSSTRVPCETRKIANRCSFLWCSSNSGDEHLGEVVKLREK